MGHERDPRNTDPRRDDYLRRDPQGYGRDRGWSSQRDDHGSTRDYYGGERYSRDREEGSRGADGERDRYGAEGRYRPHDDRDAHGGYDGREGYGQRSSGTGYGSGERQSASGDRNRTSYPSDGNRFAGSSRDDRGDRSGGRPDQGNAEDRGFLDRAGDEVRSWFGDEDAERRREMDQREDERRARESDRHYDSWRTERIAEFDRDYDEYRRENATKFGSEFGTWRTERQGQRDYLTKVDEHMEVVGSDGSHVGTVDKVRGDRLILTRTDRDAGGRHHSIPSRWIQSVDDKVTIRKTADEAKREWRDEERRSDDTGNASARPSHDDHDRTGTKPGMAATTATTATTGVPEDAGSNGRLSGRY